jgi:hypothetical protein
VKNGTRIRDNAIVVRVFTNTTSEVHGCQCHWGGVIKGGGGNRRTRTST